jgi:hypothetical protein
VDDRSGSLLLWLSVISQFSVVSALILRTRGDVVDWLLQQLSRIEKIPERVNSHNGIGEAVVGLLCGAVTPLGNAVFRGWTLVWGTTCFRAFESAASLFVSSDSLPFCQARR